MNTELRQALEQSARRLRQARLWSALALCWLAWAVAAVGLSLVMSRVAAAANSAQWLLASFALAVAASALASLFWALGSARDPLWVARRVEAKHPELATGLLAAVEANAASPSGRPGFLQTAVIRTALEHRRHHDWDDVVSAWRLRGTHAAHAAALALFCVASLGLFGQARSHWTNLRSLGAWGSAAAVRVDPGDTELERGTSLLVVARFSAGVPAEASLVATDRSGASRTRTMTRSLEDPTFAGRIESIDTDLDYRVGFDGVTTKTYHVRVFEYPELERADAKLVFPRYTSLPPKTALDIRHVTAVEGTELTLLCHLNKDVTDARLVDQQGKETTLSKQERGSHVASARWKLAESGRYRVKLVDDQGRSSKLAAEIVVNVTHNRQPVLRITQPGNDVRVSPLEELKLKAEIEDDFGLVQQGISYSIAGREPKEIPLPIATALNRRQRPEHLIDLESLHAVPDQLVSYFFWAEDIGPDEKPRRTAGDMYFAEVRHFEEIFRQGEQPAGGESDNENDGENEGGAAAAGRLAELQKEIVNGTWKVMRRETAARPTAQFTADTRLLRDSQHTAIEQAGQLGGRLQDATSKANLEQAVGFMNSALARLSEAGDKSSIAALAPALAAEQAAYQALLKLRAREFQVVRGNRRQRGGNSRGGANGPSQRQLQQLELSADENRYEQHRSAQSQNAQREQQAERALRQVLNRLKELAQRQNDLNERIKELQSALEEAREQKTREEIERQLKRLREQERQILRDADDLRERMEREENGERMADARQQIEETREHLRQASQALEEGRLPQAVTEGARARGQLDNLREQLRKQSSNRFSDEMSQMRDQARRLEQDQTRLSEQLDAWNRQPQRVLRDNGERRQVRNGLEGQEKRLEELLNRMRDTVHEAEETEPLLARGLFDTVRRASQQKIPDALKAAEQLVDLGVADEAAQSSRRAGEGIGQLREGVERAARSVLGDETEGLRRASAELDDLADQVEREIARADQPAAAEGQRNDRQASARSKAQAAGGERSPEQQRKDGPAAPPNQQRDAAQQGQRQRQPQGNRGDRPAQKNAQGQQGGQGEPGPQERPGAEQGADSAPGGTAAPKAQPRQGRPQPGAPSDANQAGAAGGGNGARPGGLDRMLEGLARGPGGPITGEGFRQWSERMRDVEDLLEDPAWRAQAAQIRDRVRGAREEFRRHAKEPDWSQLRTLVADPLNELRNRISEEISRRQSPDSLVPIDRDPVPPQYAESVRRYFERLGSGR
jgi:hypothetical protein